MHSRTVRECPHQAMLATDQLAFKLQCRRRERNCSPHLGHAGALWRPDPKGIRSGLTSCPSLSAIFAVVMASDRLEITRTSRLERLGDLPFPLPRSRQSARSFNLAIIQPAQAGAKGIDFLSIKIGDPGACQGGRVAMPGQCRQDRHSRPCRSSQARSNGHGLPSQSTQKPLPAIPCATVPSGWSCR